MPFWSDGKARPVAVLPIVIGASGAQITLGRPAAGHRTAHATFEAGRMAAAVRAFTLQARAKFNVRLEVGAPAADGLHAIRSLVGDLAVCDQLEFAPSSAGFSVVCDEPSISPEVNLAYRAAKALEVVLPDIEIRIAKRIPLQAGLGGGSADAAATLRGLAKVLKATGVTVRREALMAAAVRTGSDVAACLVPGFKVVTGTGDIVDPIDLPPPAWGVLLLKPSVSVDTATAYRMLDAHRASGRPIAEDDSQLHHLADAIKRSEFGAACSLMRNDFQSTIDAAYPAVADAARRLRSAGAQIALLCGSGACVAGLYPTLRDAVAATSRLQANADEWTCATGFGHER